MTMFYTFKNFTEVEWTLPKAQVEYTEVIYTAPQTWIKWLQLCALKVQLDDVDFEGFFFSWFQPDCN